MLTLFPLLRPAEAGGSIEVKRAYLEILTSLFDKGCSSGVGEEWTRQLHQLASLAVIHPALNGNERQKFSEWLREAGQLTSPESCLKEVSDFPLAAVSSIAKLQSTNSCSAMDEPPQFLPTASTNGVPTTMDKMNFPAAHNAAASPNSSGFVSDHASLSPLSSASGTDDTANPVNLSSGCSGAFQQEGMRGKHVQIAGQFELFLWFHDKLRIFLLHLASQTLCIIAHIPCTAQALS